MLETSAPILLGGARSSEPELTDPQESDFARIEALLALRTRNLGVLQREFDRRDRLLREALERLGASSTQELATLRQRHDAAIDRALEAEFACAELRFALDETRAQLTAAPAGAGPGAAAGAVGAVAAGGTDTQTLRARVSELEECEQQTRARLHAVEKEKAVSAERATSLERELLDARARLERGERTWAQERAAQDGGHDALVGERAGLEWRLDEVERAWHSAAARARVAQARHDETREELVASQTERAELLLRVQASTARAIEQEQALAARPQELANLRAELAAVHHEHKAQTAAFDEERRSFQAQLHQVGGQVSAGDAQLLEALNAAQHRVRELETALSSQPIEAPETRSDAAPGPIVDVVAAERGKRRKLAVTVRALQAASEAGEAVAPWIDELVELLAEYVSLPPRTL